MAEITVGDQTVDITLSANALGGEGQYWLAKIDSPFTGDAWMLEVHTHYGRTNANRGQKGYVARLIHNGESYPLGWAPTQALIRQAAAHIVLGYEPVEPEVMA